jgi:hypothetical protein
VEALSDSCDLRRSRDRVFEFHKRGNVYPWKIGISDEDDQFVDLRRDWQTLGVEGI